MKAYKIILSDNKSIELVDKEYIDQQIDSIKNIILETLRSNNLSLPNPKLKIKPATEIIDLNQSNIDPNKIKQDSSHRMLTDAQIQLFKNKPTLNEVDDKVSLAANELKITIEKMFTNILNLPDTLKNLQQIAEAFVNSPLNTVDGIKTILNKFSDLAIKLDDHIESGKHINNNERKALNLTVDLVNNGMLDKVCSGTVPHSEIADDAKSLNGITADSIRGRHLEEVIYGIQPYDKTLVDVLFDKSEELDSKFNSTLPTNGSIGFKPGTYDGFTIFNIKSDLDLIINGSGSNSTTIIADRVLTKNNVIRDISFKRYSNLPCELSILDNTIFDNCNFTNCEIDIHADYNVKFVNCEFINVKKFNISKTSTNIIIQNNVFDINSVIPKSMGINNRIIKDNLTNY